MNIPYPQPVVQDLPDEDKKLLEGIRIIDLTAVLMGPYATQLLGDMGADVIKIESLAGDTSRGIGPTRSPGMGSNFLQVNRNKRSIAIDLKSAEGRDIMTRLIKTADAMVYNVRPAALARLKLSYEDVKAIKPDIIHVGVFGYGQNGPYANYPAYDDLIQGAIGLPTLLGRTGDGIPRYVPLAFVDRAVGLSAVNAVTAALFHRQRTGRGQAVEVPMFETMVPFVLGEHFGGEAFNPPEGPYGYQRLLAPERRPYATRDGHVCAVIYTDKHWRSFFALTGRESEFDADPRLQTISARTRHMSALCAEAAEVFRGDTTQNWLRRLNAADIPCIVLNAPETLMDDPHLKAVDYFEEVDHPSEGLIRHMRHPTEWSDFTPPPGHPVPRHGQHTREVLLELGYTADDIQNLANGHVITAE